MDSVQWIFYAEITLSRIGVLIGSDAYWGAASSVLIALGIGLEGFQAAKPSLRIFPGALLLGGSHLLLIEGAIIVAMSYP
jgi:hypothetical protein